MTPEATLTRLLELPADRRLLATWAKGAADEGGERHDRGDFRRLYDTIRTVWPQDPGLARRAVEHVVAARLSLSGEDAAYRDWLEANSLLAVGRVEEARPAYRRAWNVFDRRGHRDTAGRIAIGWSGATAVAGDPRETERIVERGLRDTPRRDAAARGRLQNNLGTAWHLAGHYESATTHYTAATKSLRKAGADAMAGATKYNLGLLAILLGEFRRARRDLEEARETLQAAGNELHALYAEVGLLELDLHQGEWDRGTENVDRLREAFAARGDERATAWLHRELARLFTSLGAVEAGAHEAARARPLLQRLGVAGEAAIVAFLEGRLARAQGAPADAFARLAEASEHWRGVGHERALDRATLETARTYLAAAQPEEALAALAPLRRRLERKDPAGLGAICRGLVAEAHRQAGRTALALRFAREAHRAARRHPANLERPQLSLVLARASAARRESMAAVRFARRAIDEHEALLARFGRRHFRALVGDSREHVVRAAVSVVLAHGGRRAVASAVDLLAKARSPLLIEDLLHADVDAWTDETRAAITRLRDELLASPDDAAEDTRHRALRSRIDDLETRLTPDARRVPQLVRHARDRRALDAWRGSLGDRELVWFDESEGGWRAFLVRNEGPSECVELPDATAALRDAWLPLRLAFETAARLPTKRRREFLDRTRASAHAQLNRLREAFWRPLPRHSHHTVVVPHGELHSLPWEAISGDAISRIPHPALLRRPSACYRPGRERPRTSLDALVLAGTTPGSDDEGADVAQILRSHGVSAKTGRRRRDLERAGRLGVLHVAAHGTFHREQWLLSGLRLADGWLGFEQLDRRQLAGALVQFTSCESGHVRHLPGSDFEGWITAGLAAGAAEIVLTLWKIDDDAGTRFARAFYAEWAAGRSAAAAAALARSEMREAEEHPFGWGAFAVVG